MPLACMRGFFRWALAFGFAHAKKKERNIMSNGPMQWLITVWAGPLRLLP
jgi:hypothetical protein